MMVLRLHEGPEVMRRTRAKAGFTIIELMVVVAIVAVLATVAVMAYTRHVRKARAGEVTVMINEFKTKEEAYHAERGQYLPLSPLGEGTPVWLPDDLGACTPKVAGHVTRRWYLGAPALHRRLPRHPHEGLVLRDGAVQLRQRRHLLAVRIRRRHR